MVARKRINVTLYVHCLSDWPFKEEAQTALFKDPARTAL